VRDADALGELAFEGVDVRPEGRNPVRLERVQKVTPFQFARVGRREIDSLHVESLPDMLNGLEGEGPKSRPRDFR
jgi:hypothetical protein